VGLYCNPTAVAPDLSHAADRLAEKGHLRCLFGPEHGIRGVAQDMAEVDHGVDSRLGLPVYSLYGTSAASLTPKPDWLEGLDLVIIDIQDVGSRYYTYVWSAVLLIEVCSRLSVDVLVLDRPNPLGGELVEGPDLEHGFESFVGLHDVVVRHGLTIGELVRLVAAERGLAGCKLDVVTMEGWKRGMHFEDCALPWVLPSPNMPSPDTARVYPGGCLLEGTNLSEGRGTTRPFEIVGAPWIDGATWAAALARDQLPGVVFRPLSFLPTFHKYRGEACGGVQVHVIDRDAFRPFLTGVALLRQAQRLWPEVFRWRVAPYEFVVERPAIDLLAGGSWLRTGIDRGAELNELTAGWREAETAFLARRAAYLLY
jgi:uncharacterized protein YbbC (DUF1343 family)